MRWPQAGLAGDPRLSEAARVIRDAFVDLDVDYRLIGGLALELQGVEVGTTDIDILVAEEDFDTVRREFEEFAQPLAFSASGTKKKADTAPVYEFPGADGVVRPVSFFRLGDIDIDLLGAVAPAEKVALEEPPVLTTAPRGFPAAPLAAVVAIKLSAGREKDYVQVEQVAAVLGLKRSKAVHNFLVSRGLEHLVEDWDAAVLRATTPPRER
jgi:hypothetical protein